MIDRFILLAITPMTLAGGALGWTSWETTDRAVMTGSAMHGGDAGGSDLGGSDAGGSSVRGAAGGMTAYAAQSRNIIARSHDGLFHATARIGGQRLRMIIDTGASTSILSARDARRLDGVRISRHSVGTMRTLGGDTRYHHARVAEVKLGSQHIIDADFAVLQTPDDVSVIGQDILRQLGPIILDGDTLILP